MSRRWTVSAAIILLIAAVDSPMSAEERRPGSPLKKDHVRFCADAANLPFSSQDGQIPGFEVELARLIARELGVEARFQWILTWVRPYWELKRGECDVFMGLPPSPRLTQANPWIAVSRPYYTMTYAIVARADAAIREPSDLAGKRVAVDAGRPAEYWLLEHGFERGIYKRQEDVFRGVEVGEAPAGLLPFPLATWLSRDKSGLVVIPLAEPSLAFSLGAATRRDDGPLTEVVDDTIARLLATGAIEEILRRYKAVP